MADIITLNKNKAGILLLKHIVMDESPISDFLGIVSINDPGKPPADGVEYLKRSYDDAVLIQYYHDVDIHKNKNISQTETRPSLKDVQEIIDFGQQHMQREGRIVVHCHAGQSRSTAATYILFVIKHGPGHEQHAWDRMVECSQSNYWPNMDVLEIAQRLLPDYDLMKPALKHHLRKMNRKNQEQ